MNVHVSCSRRTVTSHSASDVKNLITWSDSAERINAASSVQTNITLKDAWHLQIKDVVLTVMKITNSEDASVSNDNSRWNKRSKSIKTDRSEASKYNCTFLQFLSSLLSSSSADSMNSSSSMNSLNSTNSSKFTNSFSSANSSSSTTVVLKTRSLVAHESTWQMIEVKKRRVDHFSCMSSDSDKTSLKQSQKW